MRTKKKQKSHARAKDKTQFTLALPKVLMAQITAAAKDTTRSKSNWIVYTLEQAVKAQGINAAEVVDSMAQPKIPSAKPS